MHRSTSYIFTENITLQQVFFSLFVNSDKLPGFCVSGTWIISRLLVTIEEKSKL